MSAMANILSWCAELLWSVWQCIFLVTGLLYLFRGLHVAQRIANLLGGNGSAREEDEAKTTDEMKSRNTDEVDSYDWTLNESDDDEQVEGKDNVGGEEDDDEVSDNDDDVDSTFTQGLVVALDFGSAFSGFSLASGSAGVESREGGSVPDSVGSGSVSRSSGSSDAMGGPDPAKQPTCVLFTPGQQFCAFGEEAEDRYAALQDDSPEEARRWFFFQDFKKELLDARTLTRDMTTMDQTGKPMKLLVVVSATIRHLKEQAEAEMERRELSTVNLTWVLLVPAFLEDKAKQFMRESAAQAGINSNLTLAPEVEAASVFCQKLFQNESFAQVGKRFVTVNCGGGCMDISVFEVKRGGRLHQVKRPRGRPFNGQAVVEAFLELVQKLIAHQGSQAAALSNTDTLMLRREFQRQLQTAKSSDTLAIRIPTNLRLVLASGVKTSSYGRKVWMEGDKLMLKGDVKEGLFQTCRQVVISSIRHTLGRKNVGNPEAIILVGGLAESKVIQKSVAEAFPEKRVKVPPSAATAVTKASIQYCRRPQVIAERKAAYTYGIKTMTFFVPGLHDPLKKQMIEGTYLCRDIFHPFIRINEKVGINHKAPSENISPAHTGLRKMPMDIYRSTKHSPMYVTEEDCENIGHFIVEMPDLKGEKNREVEVTMSLSGAELKVTARDGNTGREFATTIDLLSRI